MNNFISKFKQTSYYKDLFEIDTDILLIYVGGSRSRKITTEFSDYDIGIITLDGEHKDLIKQVYLQYNDKKVHWYYCPIRWFFSAVCDDLCLYSGILCLRDISDDLIIYKNPKYEKILDELFKLKTKLITPICYNIFESNRDYILEVLNDDYILPDYFDRALYLLCITSYYLFDELFNVDFLTALNINKHNVPLSNEYKQKIKERLYLAINYIDQNPLDTFSILKDLYEQFESKTSANKYLSKYNFGEDYRIWDPWVGCFKITEACANCYVKPENTFKKCYYPFPYADSKPGTFITVCLRSDFFLEEADIYRSLAWSTIKNNPNLIFMIITKRVNRIAECLPDDWKDGYDNVIICVTAENQKRADERLPVLLDLPIKHKWVTCSPLLEPIQLSPYLKTCKIEHVEVTGERKCSKYVRPTQYEWVDDICKQCIDADVRFSMLYLGHNFIMPDGSIMKDWSRWCRSRAADSLELSHYKPLTFQLQDFDITY